jgi:hypothetical protein
MPAIPGQQNWATLISSIALLGQSRPVTAQNVRSTDHGQDFRPLRGERITESHLLSFPTLISVVGEALIVIDFNADTMGIVLDRSTGQVLARFGPTGTSYGEFRAPIALDEDRSTVSSFWVVDAELHRATRLSLLSAPKRSVHVRTDSIVVLALETSTPIVSSFVDSSGAIILAGFFEGPRFARVLTGKAGWAGIGPLPPGDERVPTRVRQHAYQTSMAPHPAGGRFAAATRYSDRIEVYASDGSRLAEAARLRSFEPLYSTSLSNEGPILRAGLDLRYAYLSLAADSEGFFALYSGRNHLETPGRAASGAVIEQYDWKAVRQRVYGIDQDAVAIATDQGGHFLYALVNGRIPGVFRYRVPP